VYSVINERICYFAGAMKHVICIFHSLVALVEHRCTERNTVHDRRAKNTPAVENIHTLRKGLTELKED